MIDLKDRNCVAPAEGTPPLNEPEIKALMKQLPREWKVLENNRLIKNFPFEDFKRGMAFAQEIAFIAEQENHHPDICIHYSSVVVTLSTHMIGGLSENDFILAAKIEQL